jgi:hypothetical protein
MALGMKICNRSPGSLIELAVGCQTFSADRSSFQYFQAPSTVISLELFLTGRGRLAVVDESRVGGQ